MDANKTDSVAVLRAADLPALWRQRAARKKQCGLPKEAELDLTHAAELEAALSAQGEEPVAWAYRSEDPYDAGQWMLAGPTWEGEPRPNRREVIPLYLHPAPPGADAVTEAVPSDVMQHARHMVEGHYPRHREYQVADWLLRLAARTGQGEA